ncbi:S-layer homology domain-containing protein [Candidatus Margulisiibacteriota bacterium]
MTKRFFIITLLYCFIVTPCLGVSGTTLDPSTTLYSARQLGMGGVSAAFSDDATGVFSNPAGLSNIEFPQMTGASRKLVLDETQYTLLCWAMPTDFGTLGLGYTGMSISGSLPTKLDPSSGRIVIDPSREATAYDNSVVAFSYSKQLPIFGLALGLNYKMFTQALEGDTSSTATGTGIDVGLAFKPRNWLKVGALLQNVSAGSLQWDGGAEDTIGGYYKLGLALNLLGSSEEAMFTGEQRLLIGLDADSPNKVLSSSSNQLLYHLGAEYFPFENIAVRLGYNQSQSGSGLTYGIGIINGGFRFDYAFAQRPEIPGDTPHYFSFSYIGERVFSTKRTLKKKEASFKFIMPTDRMITDQEFMDVSAEARTTRIMDDVYSWTVTGVSATSEIHAATESEPLLNVSWNGEPINQEYINRTVQLKPGRNVFELTGYTSPDASAGILEPEAMTAKVHVLYFEPPVDLSLDYWVAEPIALCMTMDLIKGYPDDTFRPEKGITRAELVTLLVRSLGIPDSVLEENAFTEFVDVPSDHWATKYIASATANNLVTGYPNGTFKPNKVLNRAEGVTILARYAKLPETTEADAPFIDLSPNFWANKYLSPAKAAGMLQYLEDQNFDPSANFTRAEACEVLYRAPSIQKMVDEWWNTGLISSQQQQPAAAPAEEAAPAAQETPAVEKTVVEEIAPVVEEIAPAETPPAATEVEEEKEWWETEDTTETEEEKEWWETEEAFEDPTSEEE